jgi:hypothetical protein
MQFCIVFIGQTRYYGFVEIHGFYSPAGNNLIEEWYLDQPEEAQAEFDVTLKGLAITEDWRGLPEFKSLGIDGLCEIRFKAAKVQYRPAGFFGPGAKCFSIYVGCYKKGKVYSPPDAFDLAMKRRGKVLRGEASLRERFV